MYLYLYDSFLNHKKYSNTLARLETRLTDLGIGGKIFRLSPLRDIDQLLNDEAKNGIKTVIVVGNDKTFCDIVNIAAKLDVTLGLVPVGPDNKIARALGISSSDEACNVIAARITERIDLGKANGVYFLSSISVASGERTIECENQFSLVPQEHDLVTICNLNPALAGGGNYFNPRDGFLEVLVQPIIKGFFKKADPSQNSVVPVKEVAIRSRTSVAVTTDGKKVLKTPVEIKIVPKKLNLIVGKNRIF